MQKIQHMLGPTRSLIENTSLKDCIVFSKGYFGYHLRNARIRSKYFFDENYAVEGGKSWQYHKYKSWRNAHKNKTYDKAHCYITRVFGIGTGLYCWLNTPSDDSFKSLLLLGGGYTAGVAYGYFNQFTIPLTVGLCVFNKLDKSVRKTKDAIRMEKEEKQGLKDEKIWKEEYLEYLQKCASEKKPSRYITFEAYCAYKRNDDDDDLDDEDSWDW